MSLSKAIINRIIRDREVTLTQLESRAHERGLSLEELYQALEEVHNDKRITVTNLKAGVTYRPTLAKRKEPGSHLAWLREHYPWPDDFVMPFPSIDMSWMFLRSKEERAQYKAAAKGMPVHMYNKKNGYPRK